MAFPWPVPTQPGFYKSLFLNALESTEPPNAYWGDIHCTIHPLVALYDTQKLNALRGGTSPEAPKYFDPQTRIKVAEYNRMGLSVTEWDGKAKAFAALFKEKALAAGFEKGKATTRPDEGMNRLYFHRTSPSGIVFYIGYPQLGPILGVGRHLPFYYWTSSPESTTGMSMLTLEHLIPGLGNYTGFNRALYPMAYYGDMTEMAKCATIGIQAVLQAYRLLIDSL